MEGVRHIIITGKVGVGKSTLIRKLLRHTPRKVSGFITLKVAIPGASHGECGVYMFPAARSAEERKYTAENLLGSLGERNEFHPEVFDTLGVSLIRAAEPDGVILMDELGFMESGAEEFKKAVLNTLRGETPVIVSLKLMKGVSFLDDVRSCPGAAVYTVTEENRDELEKVILENETGFFQPARSSGAFIPP